MLLFFIQGIIMRREFIKIYFGIVLLSAINISAQTADSSQSSIDTLKYNIENCVNAFSMDKAEKTKAGYQYWFIDKNFLDGTKQLIRLISTQKMNSFLCLKGRLNFT
jgi:hypothetical protein